MVAKANFHPNAQLSLEELYKECHTARCLLGVLEVNIDNFLRCIPDQSFLRVAQRKLSPRALFYLRAKLPCDSWPITLRQSQGARLLRKESLIACNQADISLPAYLESYEANRRIVQSFLGKNYTLDEDFVEALNLWCGYLGSEQVPVNGCKRSVWDSPMIARINNSLISDSRDLVNRTRLAAVSTREPDTCLNALIIASVGTLHRPPRQ
ncbi:hypothetical protein ACOME3_006256 [Neoechinorhynchus agilis]